MARAKNITLHDIRPNKGRCPWRIEYRIDDSPVNAFFRPPPEIADGFGSKEVFLIALPILCDLAAEVRPQKVDLGSYPAAALFRRIFNGSAGALLLEQDASYGKSYLTPLPELFFKTGAPPVKNVSLFPKRAVLGFSGGKDSIVSLFALLESGYEVLPVLLNEGDRTWQDIKGWVPKLVKLGLRPMVAYLSAGRRKYLREKYGDWYFSSYQIGWLLAILALCAVNSRAGLICLGIEASATGSLAFFQGRPVNHQYQKTTEHLRLIERFYRQVLHPDLRIASPIANISDTDVLKILLEKVPRSFQDFSSCGASNWRSKHCGACAKCAFIYVLLSSLPKGRRLAERIFRRDMLQDIEVYRPWLDDRFRLPAGCIGPKREVWAALETLADTFPDKPLKPVLKKWKGSRLRRGLYNADGQPDQKPVKSGGDDDGGLGIHVPDATSLIHKWLDAG